MAKIWKKHKGLSVGKCTNKPCHIHAMKNNTTVEMNDLKKYQHCNLKKKIELKKQVVKKFNHLIPFI